MKVLLTGAAGTIGKQVLKDLIEDGRHEVTAIDIKKGSLDTYQNQATIRYVSIRDKEKMIHLIRHTDAIIHLAGITPPLANRKKEITKQVNVDGTKTIIDIIKKYNPTCHLLFISSINVYGSRLENPYIQVGDPLIPNKEDYYAKTKIEVEERIRTSNIHYTIFRLTGVIDHFNLDPLLFHMPLATKLEIISLKDASRALINSLDHRTKLDQRIFNVSGGTKCRTTYYNFLKTVLNFYGLNIDHIKKEAFAKENYHCGFLLDSHELEDIISFQNDTLETCYQNIKKQIPLIKKITNKLYPSTYILMMKSLPLRALRTNNQTLKDHFFKKGGNEK